ncbi:hypothetical protein NKR23_g11248 [Pleurostoma richardsiae]|uniref:NADP-dependent oxidoreductase domain-containing protein n=1 Tax=Pleurostoma richardsiae TaxID=41990 RepID=A0AA38RJZ0_9PEZI|nr:hypothetical protein NKR23_g11248 [Pleurostoma richardsiae]
MPTLVRHRQLAPDASVQQWVGEWMKSRGNRNETVLATKYSTNYRGAHKDEIQSNFGGNGSKSMKISLKDSLKNLQTTYIDLFYLHQWDYTVSIPELTHSLNGLVVAGKYARCMGLRPFVVYQGMWNAAMRDFERDIIPMCQVEGVGLAPYGILNQGRFQTAKGFEKREKNNPG